MSHSFNKIWIHAIWTTKGRISFIQNSIEPRLHQFIKEQLREQGCIVRIVNGMPDHIHCLFILNRNKSIAEVIKQAKGSSSCFVNQNELISDKFAWQTGYAAFSVSESISDKVYHYIKNQKQHHQKMDFTGEYNKFLKIHGLENSSKYGNG